MRFDWSAEVLNASPQAVDLRERFEVSPKLVDKDYIFNALVYSCKEDVELAYEQYIADGRRNAEQVKEAIEAHLPLPGQALPETGIRVLDFASGYGRVTRHFRNIAPQWNLSAADIHPEAKAFNEAELGVETFLSSFNPGALKIPTASFDAVFCLSFFSHVRDRQFARWLRALLRLLRKDGILLITTHGEASMPLLEGVKVSKSGYGMIETSEQFDIPTDYYVHACTTRGYVERQLARAGGGFIEVFRPGAWWGHQDMYVIRRTEPDFLGRLREDYLPIL